MTPRRGSEEMREEEDEEEEEEEEEEEGGGGWIFPSFSGMFSGVNPKSIWTVCILIYVNFINYMDRSTLAGMTSYVKRDPDFAFKENDDKYLGFLQSAFVGGYMLTAPIFGYIGDRKDRKILLLVGISFWTLSSLIGSFATNYWAFLAFRCLVGVGEASYSTVAPAIISDLFSDDTRSRVLALFYFAIPVGTGLGYMIGSNVASEAGNWRWGLRVTPLMGVIALVLILFFMEDPPRGESDGVNMRANSTKDDIKALVKSKSFVTLTIGFTCVTFCAGALMWWGPRFAYLGAKVSCGNRVGCETIHPDTISNRFGIVMTFAGLIGVPAGSYVAQYIRHRVANADPLVCAYTLLVSVPVLFFGLVSAQYSISWCYGLTFLAGLLLNCNWSIIGDITLYIVIPSRRSFASAGQILVSHLLGDAFSPFMVGAVADAIRPSIKPDVDPFNPINSELPPTYQDQTIDFIALQYSLFSVCFFQAAGALFFFILSFYIIDDKRKAQRDIYSSYEGRGDTETTPIIREVNTDQ